MKKKSLIIVLVVLIVSALFIACNSDVASSASGDKAVYSIKIADNNSKGLTGTSSSTIESVANLYWYYTATKADNSVYTIGATNVKTAIDGNANVDGIQAGLLGASLGEFSQGYWTFQFWGYKYPNNEYALDSANNLPVYYSEAFTVGVFEDKALEVTLKKGAGIPAGTVSFTDITSAVYNFASGDSKELKLTVKEGDNVVAQSSVTAVVAQSSEMAVDSQTGIATFNLSTITPEAGDHTYKFIVTHVVTPTGEQEAYTEAIGENSITVNVQPGVNVDITGSIDKLIIKYIVSVGTVNEPSIVNDNQNQNP